MGPRLEASALDLLKKIARPLHPSSRSPLARAVAESVALGKLSPLEKLPARLRQELLEQMETHLDGRGDPAEMAAVVRLTTAISGIALSRSALRRLAAPAR